MRIELDGDERVVVRTRPHPRGLRSCAWGLIVLLVLYGFVTGLLSRVPELGGWWADAAPYLGGLAGFLLLLGALAWVIAPAWRWLRRRFVITTRRVIVVAGSRPRRELPLEHIIAVDARPGVGASQDGPGTLVFSTPRGEARVRHVPDVRRAAGLVRELRRRLPWAPGPIPPPDPYGGNIHR